MRCNWAAIVMCLVAMSGCGPMEGASFTTTSEGTESGGGVYVVDTRTGAVRYCRRDYSSLGDSATTETDGMKCGAWSDTPPTAVSDTNAPR
jgi:hypothetical protein